MDEFKFLLNDYLNGVQILPSWENSQHTNLTEQLLSECFFQEDYPPGLRMGYLRDLIDVYEGNSALNIALFFILLPVSAILNIFLFRLLGNIFVSLFFPSILLLIPCYVYILEKARAKAIKNLYSHLRQIKPSEYY